MLFCGILICNCIRGAYLLAVSPGKTQVHVRSLDLNHSVIHLRLILSYWCSEYIVLFLLTPSKNVGHSLLEVVSHLKTTETRCLMVARL